MTTKLPPPFDKTRPQRVGATDWENTHLPADPVHVRVDDDAPDDYEPLPDAMLQLPDFLYAVTALQAFFWGRPGVLVSGDTPVYYIDYEGDQQIVRPDCYVSFGVNPISIRRRNGYFISEAGKSPDFVLEIASETTHTNDTSFKRELYARLGVTEYWRFDSEGTFYPEPLAGELLVNGEYTPIETVTGPDLIIRGHSPILGLDLCWDDNILRYYDPVAQGFLLNLLESGRRLSESGRRLSESQAAQEAAAERLHQEQAARQAAEERVRQLEEQLRRRPSGQ